MNNAELELNVKPTEKSGTVAITYKVDDACGGLGGGVGNFTNALPLTRVRLIPPPNAPGQHHHAYLDRRRRLVRIVRVGALYGLWRHCYDDRDPRRQRNGVVGGPGQHRRVDGGGERAARRRGERIGFFQARVRFRLSVVEGGAGVVQRRLRGLLLPIDRPVRSQGFFGRELRVLRSGPGFIRYLSAPPAGRDRCDWALGRPYYLAVAR